MFFKLKLYRWKHNPGRQQQELIVRRNFANPEFCPVLTMLHWLDTLKTNGIGNGPLFPALNKAHDEFLREEIDGVMHLQRMSAATFGKWTREALCTRAASSRNALTTPSGGLSSSGALDAVGRSTTSRSPVAGRRRRRGSHSTGVKAR